MLVFGLFVVASIGLVVTIAAYLVSGFYLDIRDRLNRRRRRRVIGDLSVLLFDSNEDAASVHENLISTKKNVLLDLIQRLALDVNGEAQHRLQQLVRTCGLERLIRRRARSRRWRRRVQAAQLHYLVTHPDFDRRPLLFDRHSLVRARAVETLTSEQAVEHASALVELLADPSLAVRLAAKHALLRCGSAAIAPLIELLDSPDGFAAEALEVAADLPDAELVYRLTEFAKSEDSHQREMAARALGSGTGVGAINVLEELLSDDVEDVRVAAVNALGRLDAKECVVAVGRRMQDPSFRVRREAGYVLDGLGAPGQLVLRQMLRSSDPFARDMARQVLDASLSLTTTLGSALWRRSEMAS